MQPIRWAVTVILAAITNAICHLIPPFNARISWPPKAPAYIKCTFVYASLYGHQNIIPNHKPQMTQFYIFSLFTDLSDFEASR